MHQIPWACSTWCRYSRLPIWMSYRTYRSVCYRHRWRTQLTEVCGTGMKVFTGNSATGIYVVRNLPNCPVPVNMSYRTYRSVRCQYRCRTELTEVSGTGDAGSMPRNAPYRIHPFLYAVQMVRMSEGMGK